MFLDFKQSFCGSCTWC